MKVCGGLHGPLQTLQVALALRAALLPRNALPLPLSEETNLAIDIVISSLQELDDWQRGFIDSVFHSQNIKHPTPEQLTAALRRMTSYVVERSAGELPTDGRISLAQRT